MVKKEIVLTAVSIAAVCVVGCAMIVLRHQHHDSHFSENSAVDIRPSCSDVKESSVRKLAKSPRCGRVYWGETSRDGQPCSFAYRFNPPVRTPISEAQSNEIAVVFARMAEAYAHGEREAMLACTNELPDVVTNIPDRVFAQLVSPLARPLIYEFANTDGPIPHEMKDFDDAKAFESYVRINLDVALFIGNMYLKRERYDKCPLEVIDATVLKQLLLYKEKFHAAERYDLEKVADGFIEEWHGQIESESGFTRQVMWFQVDFLWGFYNSGELSLEKLSERAKKYAKPLIRIGYTPKWLSEFDDLSEAVK